MMCPCTVNDYAAQLSFLETTCHKARGSSSKLVHVTNTVNNTAPDRVSMCGSSSWPPCLQAVRVMEGPGGGLGLTGVEGCRHGGSSEQQQ